MNEEPEGKLREETQKWLEKIKSKDLKVKNKDSEKFLKNIKAYINDSEHFLEKGKLIQAFEAVIWAWSWYEIGQELDVIK